MADRTVSVTDAARNFSDLVNRVYYTGETATLVRNGVAVARVVPAGPTACPAARLADAWPGLPHLPPADARTFAADVARARAELPPPRDPWA